MAKRRVIWHKPARNAFLNHLSRIKEDSLQGDESVYLEISKIIASLPQNPQRYPIDKFKLNNDGSFRVFEKMNCRISFWVNEDKIIILRFRHTKQKPLNY